MEARLDDAIHVLRNHAEGQILPGHPGMSGMMHPTHSNGIMGNMGAYVSMGMPTHMESHMVSDLFFLYP